MNRRAAIVAAAAMTGGCGSRREERAPSPAEATATPTPTHAAAVGSDEPVVSAGPTITVEEASGVIPAIADAAIVEAPRAAMHGQQVHVGWCIAAADQAAAIEVVTAALVGQGWGEIHGRGVGARIAVSGDRPPYRLQATVIDVARTGCSPAEKKWFASVAIYKIESIERPPGLEPATP